MVKKSRKAKNRNSDFQKVKFKVGRKLQKADNETTTSFKTRGIHLKEQLSSVKKDSNVATTKRKQTFLELSTQLHHYNDASRHDAVLGLEELFKSHPSLIQFHLSHIIDSLPEMFTDKDGKVRSAVIDLLKNILPHVSATSLSPFFSTVSAHLCCAMTHIYEDIKLCSLAILDLFLKFYPGLVAIHSNRLLPIFLDQILQRNHSKKPGTNSCMMSINPNSKLSSPKFRGKVLDRLGQLLKAIVEHIDGSFSKRSSTCHESVSQYHDSHYGSFLAVVGSNDVEMMEGYPICLSSSIAGTSDPSGALSEDIQKVRDLADFVVPFLLQIWIEVVPQQSSSGSVVHDGSVVTLTSVLDIITLLWQYLCAVDGEEKARLWFEERFVQDFMLYFMSSFPHTVHQQAVSRKHKSTQPPPQVSETELNIAVCNLMSQFITTPLADFSTSLTGIIDYVAHAVRENATADTKMNATLMGILMRLLKTENITDENQERLFSSLYELYRTRPGDVTCRGRILQYLSDVVGVNSAGVTQCSAFREWMASLPLSLVMSKKASERDVILRVMSRVMTCGQSDLMTAVHQNFDTLADLLPGVSSKVALVHVFSCLDHITVDHFRRLSTVCRHRDTDVKTIQILLHTLYHRFEVKIAHMNSNERLSEFSNLMSFLLSITFGYTVDTDNCVTSSQDQTTLGRVKIDLKECNDMKRHDFLTKIVCDILLSFPSAYEVWKIVSTVIESNLMQSDNILHHFTAFSIIFVTKSLSSSAETELTKPHIKVTANVCINVLCELFCLTEIGREGESKDTEMKNVSNHDLDMGHSVVAEVNMESAVANQDHRKQIQDLFMKLIQSLLTVQQGVLQEMLVIIENCVDGNKSRAFRMAQLLREILLPTEVKVVSRPFVKELQKILSLIKDACTETEQAAQWLTDLKYEVSLIKQT